MKDLADGEKIAWSCWTEGGMMRKLNTVKEVLNALADGEKIAWSGWNNSGSDPKYIYIGKDGRILTDLDKDPPINYYFKNDNIGFWFIYESPEELDEVFQWRYLANGKRL